MSSIQSTEYGLEEIFQRLTQSYELISKDPAKASPKTKAQLRIAALELIAATQAPHEAAIGFALQNAVHPCYRTAGDCGILSKWPKETMSAKELADLSGADYRLIGANTPR
jgi:hypothetical protein